MEYLEGSIISFISILIGYIIGWYVHKDDTKEQIRFEKRMGCYQPNVDNTTNPPLRNTNTYIENGMPKFPEDRITKHQEG